MSWYYKRDNWSSQQEFFANKNKKQQEVQESQIRDLEDQDELEEKIIEYLNKQKAHLTVQQISEGIGASDPQVLAILNSSRVVKKSATPIDAYSHSVRYYVE